MHSQRHTTQETAPSTSALLLRDSTGGFRIPTGERRKILLSDLRCPLNRLPRTPESLTRRHEHRSTYRFELTPPRVLYKSGTYEIFRLSPKSMARVPPSAHRQTLLIPPRIYDTLVTSRVVKASPMIADDIECSVCASTENAVMTASQGCALPSDHHEPCPPLRGEDFALIAVHRFRCRATPAPYTRCSSLGTGESMLDTLGGHQIARRTIADDAEAAFKGLETAAVLSTHSLPRPSQPNANVDQARHSFRF
ncbi:hypothetical protein EV122DRAFT_276012 [Schizophyllum commune]